jgi:DNA-nicking Smr family endonuclease
MDEEENEEGLEPVAIPIDGVLDLHTFRPRDVKELLPEYLDVCRGKGIFEVRVIHGKGSGILRKTVHSMLSRLPIVESFRTAGEDAGGWGATMVVLKPPPAQ